MVRRGLLVACHLVFLVNVANAAGQWEWTAEIRNRYSNFVIYSDPQTYPSQSDAVAAMRQLSLPGSSNLATSALGRGNVRKGTIEIEYFAPSVPVAIGEPEVFDVNHNPVDFADETGWDIENPVFATSDAELVDALNAWHQANGPAVCADWNYNIQLGGNWVRWTWNGAEAVHRSFYTYDRLFQTDFGTPECYIFDRSDNPVYRIRDETCPDNYARVNDGSVAVGECEYHNKGVVKGRPYQCEVTPVSTSVGNPCDTATGAKTEVAVDYTSDTVELIRSYNSHAQAVSSFGPGWMHNYDRRMSISDGFPTMLLRPSGVANLLQSNGSIWLSTSGNGLRVKRDGSNYRIYLGSGATELYDPDGYLIELVDAAGRITTVNRDSNGLVTEVIGPFGKALTFHYDSESKLISIDDPAGNSIHYDYGAGGQLTAVTYQDGTTKQYHYEDTDFPYHLTGTTDENASRFSTYAYDEVGRAILTSHAGGVGQLTLEYQSAQTIVTDAAGTERIFQFTTDPLRLRKLTALVEEDRITELNLPSFSIDYQRRPTRIVNQNGVITEFEYANFHWPHIVKRTDAKGTPEERVVQFQYLSPDSQLVTVETRSSVVGGQVMTIGTDYGTDNLPDSITTSGFSASGDPIQRVIATEYNALGQPVLVDGPRTDVLDITELQYYECFTGGQCGQLKSVTNALGQVTTYDSYDDHGRLLQFTDPNSKITTIGYDLRGRIETVTERSAVGNERTTSFIYDNAGQLTSTILPYDLDLTLTYNAAHLLVRVEDNLGNHIDYQYDLRGNRTDEDTFDPAGTLTQAVDVSFDLRNRVQSINAGGFVTTLTTDALGNVTEYVDPKLAATQHTYDALNRLEQTLDALGGHTDYSYDAHDNLISVTAPNSATTSYQYDDLGNLTQEVSPDRGATSYTHDRAGNIITSTDARGELTTYTYDALNRVTEIELDNGDTIVYQYDTGTNGIGRLQKITDPSGETTWTYNNFGQVTSKTHKIGTVSLTIGYGYDAAGRLTSMTLPSGKVLTYGYNDHLPASVAVDSTTILSGATYEPFGPGNGWTWGTGASTSRDYDLRGLTSSLDFAGELVTVGRDAVGQVTSLSLPLYGYALNYDYDQLGHLTDFSSLPAAAPLPVPDTQGFAYDENGNREILTEDGTPYSYTNVPYSNRLTNTAGPAAKSYTYDAAGNVTSDGIHSYGYDDRGRMVSVNSGASTYRHNGQGQRVKKDVGGTVTLFAYDEQGRLIGKYDAQGNARMEHVWFDGRPVAALKGSTVYEVHTDHLGTPRIISEGSAGIVWAWLSDPFGSTPAQEYTDGTGAPFEYNLRFPGQYYDEETGLHYNYYRTYDPSTGRYLESDPIGLQGGLNTYGYVGGNPLSYADLLGLCKVDVRFSPIAGSRWHHAYIVTTDPDGSQEYFRGGPDGNARWPSSYGSITTEYGEYGPGTPDWDADGSDPFVTVLDNDEACTCLEEDFRDTLDKIREQEIYYSPLHQNSNSVVGTALRKQALPWNGRPTPQSRHPWDQILAPAMHVDLLPVGR